MASTIWSKFFWSDWNSDPAVRLCSLAAQGLWMRMLCIAAEADPPGYVAVNGRALGVTDIAVLAGVTETECNSLLAELDRNGVFSRDGRGVIYSRRMLRDTKNAKKNQKNGKLGGNPNLRKQRQISEWDNPPDNPPDKGGDKGGDKAHKPIANSHKPENSSSGRGWDPPPGQPSSLPVTARHRIIAADLLDRAKADLSNWDRKFLTDLIGKATLSAKMQDILDGLAAKAGLTADAVMATWRKRLATARATRKWDHKWGPQPGQPGCLAPDELLLDGDGSGWERWDAGSPSQPATGTAA